MKNYIICIILGIITGASALYCWQNFSVPTSYDPQAEILTLRATIEVMAAEDFILQMKLNAKIDTLYLTKTKIKTKYETIYIHIDSLSDDSVHGLFTRLYTY